MSRIIFPVIVLIAQGILCFLSLAGTLQPWADSTFMPILFLLLPLIVAVYSFRSEGISIPAKWGLVLGSMLLSGIWILLAIAANIGHL